MGGDLTSEQAFNLQHYRAEMEAEDLRRQEDMAALSYA